MKRSNFAQNLRELRDSRGMTQAELAKSLDVRQSTVSGWENFGKLPRSQEVTVRLLELFGVTEEELFGFSDGFYARRYGLTDAPDGAIAPSEPQKAYAPVLATVHAGEGDVSAQASGRAPIPFEVWDRHKNGFFPEVIGDCMDQVYPEHCLVYIDPDMEPRNGSIAVVEIEGDFVMRRWYMGNSALLLACESTNPEWDDIVITEDAGEVRARGVVVWFQSREELE